MQVQLYFVADLAHPHSLAGSTVTVIDVLRATSTICRALDAGAAAIVPCLEVAEARELVRKQRASAQQQMRPAPGLPSRSASKTADRPAPTGERPQVNRPGGFPPEMLLAGERGGRRIEGFDLGNSPLEFTPQRVAGRTIAFTTSNGTRALTRCVGAGRVLFGAFSNLTVLCETLQQVPILNVLCAGTDGRASREDILCGGALVERLVRLRGEKDVELDDAARLARDAWVGCGGPHLSSRSLTRELEMSHGGRNLVRLGARPDIAWAAQIDAVPVLPELDAARWVICKGPLSE